MERCFHFDDEIFDQVDLLRHYIPPCQKRADLLDFPEMYGLEAILNAGWIHYYLPEREKVLPLHAQDSGIYPYSDALKMKSLFGRLILAAIEFSIFGKQYRTKFRKTTSNLGKTTEPIPQPASPDEHLVSEVPGIIPKEQVLLRLKKWPEEGEIVVVPLLEPSDQLRGAAIDVTLGCRFTVSRRSRFAKIDTTKEEEVARLVAECQEETFVPCGEEFIIHPSDFVLGTTLEYFRFPRDFVAYVIGKSSLGRFGLIIATATKIDPGFSGVITLELTNVGTAPLVVKPGQKIAQLVLHRLSQAVAPTDCYAGQFMFSFNARKRN